VEEPGNGLLVKGDRFDIDQRACKFDDFHNNQPGVRKR
jgi:hypothetical protein